MLHHKLYLPRCPSYPLVINSFSLTLSILKITLNLNPVMQQTDHFSICTSYTCIWRYTYTCISYTCILHVETWYYMWMVIYVCGLVWLGYQMHTNKSTISHMSTHTPAYIHKPTTCTQFCYLNLQMQ